MHTDDNVAGREIRITHRLDATPERVFDAWTRPAYAGQWMGPDGFTTTTESMDVRPGGTWRYVMHGPDGTDYQNLVRYIEVVPPERLVYEHGAHEDDPSSFQVTVTFTGEAGKTRLEMQMLFSTAAERDRVAQEYGAIDGANQTLARLGNFLKETAEQTDAGPANP